ncbi:hypothetical protein [Paenibacillus sp. GCM10027626]|uniref:hypothetical protein n=1 Tax=Paenibacillus sp. GCM10027626 TaxID=3273411 RepID=UPI0036297C69
MTTKRQGRVGQLLCCAAAALIIAAGCSNNSQPEKSDALHGQDNWILDTAFESGAMVFNPIPGSARVNGKLDFGRNLEGKKTEWIVTQWNSKSDAAKMTGKRDGDRYLYENEYKTIAVADDGTITLGLDAGKEYKKPRSSQTDPWLHLYLEQRYKERHRLSEADDLTLQFEVRITESFSYMKPDEYNPGLHSSMAVFYLIIGDQKGSGDFINFCVPIYDNREDIPSGEWHIDSGFNLAGDTHKLIYTVDGKLIYDHPTGDGQWHKVNLQLKPHIEKALEIAKQNGYFSDAEYEDLGLDAIYIGWEVPGVFKSEMQIRDVTIAGSGA